MFLMMVAQVTGYRAHEFVHTFGDVHIYSNHIQGAKEQLTRTPGARPRLEINPEISDIFQFKFEDFKVIDYHPAEHIKFDIAV
jgi:thymidylate synthase